MRVKTSLSDAIQRSLLDRIDDVVATFLSPRMDGVERTLTGGELLDGARSLAGALLELDTAGAPVVLCMPTRVSWRGSP